MNIPALIKKIRFDQRGLIPVIIQDIKTDQVLMLAYMNRQALEKTLATGKTYFWSRSRQKLWMKGENSGHTQRVRQIFLDCDADTLLIKVSQVRAACHSGYYSCFYRQADTKSKGMKICAKKVFSPKKVYKK